MYPFDIILIYLLEYGIFLLIHYLKKYVNLVEVLDQ